MAGVWEMNDALTSYAAYLEPIEASHGFTPYGIAAYAGKDVEIWFERRHWTRREFSVWRIFNWNRSSAQLIWRLSVAVGNGQVDRVCGISTFSSPREYELMTERMGAQGLSLEVVSFSQASFGVGVAAFEQYRVDNETLIFSTAWDALGRLIVADDYLSVWHSVGDLRTKTTSSQTKQTDGRSSRAVGELTNALTAYPHSSGRFHDAGLEVAIQVAADRQLSMPQLFVWYKIGRAFAENQDHSELVSSELRRLARRT
jgi:hypothetical protein